jgi:hypothetical protein
MYLKKGSDVFENKSYVMYLKRSVHKMFYLSEKYIYVLNTEGKTILLEEARKHK